jgi:hypothetical protein
MKCIPMTLSGLLLTAASLVMEIDDVLVARIAFGWTTVERSVKMRFFKSKDSVAA